LLHRKSKREEPSFEEQVGQDIIIKELLDEIPLEKIILDIQDTRRYFESQTGGLDLMNLNEEDTSQVLSGYKRKFEGWQPEMAKQVMQSRSADKVCVELTNTIKRKIRHDDKSTAGKFKTSKVFKQNM
jgi:transcription initiation factor TFIIH subunit 1